MFNKDLHVINGHLLVQEKIDRDNYNRVKDMLESNDKENWLVAEEVLKSICITHNDDYIFDLFTNNETTFKNGSNIFTRRSRIQVL